MQKREIQVMIKSSKTKNQRGISIMDYCTQKFLGLTDRNFILDKIWLQTIIESNEMVHQFKG